MDFKEEQINIFVDKLASSSPVPGGGGAAALSASLSAALSCMVFNLTVGKKVYEGMEEKTKDSIQVSLANCKDKLKEFLHFINKDAEAFSSLMEAYKFPKDTENNIKVREERINQGVHNAMEVPYSLTEKVVEMMEFIRVAALYGNANVISDAGVSAILAYAAVESSILNVMVNLKFLKDADNESIIDHCNKLKDKAYKCKEEIMSEVYGRL